MTVPNLSNSVSFIGTGSTGPFTFAFPFFDNSEIVSTVTDLSGNVTTALVSGLTGAGTNTGGTLTLVNALATGYTLTITRIVPIAQTVQLPDGGPFFAATIEKMFDMVVMMIQQIWAVLSPLPALIALNAFNVLGQFIKTSVSASSFGTDISAAITALGSNSATLVVDSPITVNNNATVPANVSVVVQKPGYLTVASGKTLTINGPFSAGLYQVFAGSGTVPGLNEARPEWYGVTGTADEVAINKASLAAKVINYVPGKTYNTTAAIKIYTNQIHNFDGCILNSTSTGNVIESGAGTNTWIKNPTLNKPIITSATAIAGISLSKMTSAIVNQPDINMSTVGGIGIHFLHGSNQQEYCYFNTVNNCKIAGENLRASLVFDGTVGISGANVNYVNGGNLYSPAVGIEVNHSSSGNVITGTDMEIGTTSGSIGVKIRGSELNTFNSIHVEGYEKSVDSDVTGGGNTFINLTGTTPVFNDLGGNSFSGINSLGNMTTSINGPNTVSQYSPLTLWSPTTMQLAFYKLGGGSKNWGLVTTTGDFSIRQSTANGGDPVDDGNIWFKIDSSGKLFILPATTTSAPVAGGAGALPATPAGYMTINVNGTNRQIPYY
jgi:hypothetical protein